MSLSWHPPTLLAFAVANLLVALLTMGAGLLTEHTASTGGVVIECPPLPGILDGTSEFLFTAPADHAVRLQVNFLEHDGGIVQTQEVMLAAGRSTAVVRRAQQLGEIVRVIASAPVEVYATIVYDSNVAPGGFDAEPCNPIRSPVHG